MPKVFIDPGHGGADPGNVANGQRESDLVLSDGLAIATHLMRAGVQVKLSRTKDVFVGLSERANMANDWGADIFVSIHINGAASIATGTETWYYSEKSRPLAAALQRSMVDVLGLADRGLKQKAFTVIYKTHMPAVLLEQFFLENAKDLNRYLERREQLKASIAKAILAHLGIKEQGDDDMHTQRTYETKLASRHSINGLVSGGEKDKPQFKPWLNVSRPDGAERPKVVKVKIVPSDGREPFTKKIKLPDDRDVGFYLYDAVKGNFRAEVFNENDYPFLATVTTWVE